jgi:hypothetical protein
MILNDESTWPEKVIEYLTERSHILEEWEKPKHNDDPFHVDFALIDKFDRFIEVLGQVVSKYELRGYHCSRLTVPEIDQIMANGMQLPNKAMLCARIQSLQNARIIEASISERLKQENQADDQNRAGMLWFCFSKNLLKGRGGVIRLFNSWGGEALYNSHERDPLTGPLLRGIGSPCIIEADIPISGIPGTRLAYTVARQFLINRGKKTGEPVDHDDYTKESVPVSNIRGIYTLRDPEFARLTGCDNWIPQLT